MTKRTQPMHPSNALDLLLLRTALIAAEKEVPARPPRSTRDANELLALQLIEKIKHPEPLTFIGLQIESPHPLCPESILEMAGSDV